MEIRNARRSESRIEITRIPLGIGLGKVVEDNRRLGGLVQLRMGGLDVAGVSETRGKPETRREASLSLPSGYDTLEVLYLRLPAKDCSGYKLRESSPPQSPVLSRDERVNW